MIQREQSYPKPKPSASQHSFEVTGKAEICTIGLTLLPLRSGVRYRQISVGTDLNQRGALLKYSPSNPEPRSKQKTTPENELIHAIGLALPLPCFIRASLTVLRALQALCTPRQFAAGLHCPEIPTRPLLQQHKPISSHPVCHKHKMVCSLSFAGGF